MGHYSALGRDCCAFHVPLECDFATEATESTEELKGDQLIEQTIAAAIEVHRLPCPGLLESICEEVVIIELKSLSRYARAFQNPNTFVLESNTPQAGIVDRLWRETVGGRNHKIISVLSVAKKGVLSQQSTKFRNDESQH